MLAFEPLNDVFLAGCGTSFAAQNTGQLECSLETVLTLDQVNSDYVVAMNRTQLIGDMANYCGKKVIVSINGQPSSLPLFIGDRGPRSHLVRSIRSGNLDASVSEITDLSRFTPTLPVNFISLSELSPAKASNSMVMGHDLMAEFIDT
jgi:hypothetical protein